MSSGYSNFEKKNDVQEIKHWFKLKNSKKVANELVGELGVKKINKETMGKEGKEECKTVKKALESELLRKGLARAYFDDLYSEGERRNSTKYNSFIENLGKLDTLDEEELKNINSMIRSIHENRSEFSKKLLNKVFNKGGNSGKFFSDSILRNEKGDLDAKKLLESIIDYIDIEVPKIKMNKKIEDMKNYQENNKEELVSTYNELINSEKFEGYDLDKKVGLIKENDKKPLKILFDSTDEIVRFASSLIIKYIVSQYKRDSSAEKIKTKLTSFRIDNNSIRFYSELKEQVDRLTKNTKGFDLDKGLSGVLEKYGIILETINRDNLECDISNSILIPELAEKNAK